jgi:CheY-like chemotaxis protein
MDKLLIVDDHVENIQLITRILEKSYPEVRLYQATNVISAIELCRKYLFDLIISDWDMPGKTGIDLIRAIKANARTRHIPVIIVTAIMLTSEDLQVALSAGAHDYIRNPVDPLELTARVNAALSLSRCHLEEIKKKNAELLEKTLILVKSNEFIISWSEDLNRLTDLYAGNEEACELVMKMTGEIEQKIKEDSWQKFEIAFQNIHVDFIKNLITQYPRLSRTDVKLSLLLKLGMNNKDMASMLHQSPESLKVARSRLRRKLAMSNEVNFYSFFSAF